MLVMLGLFPNLDRARRRLRRMWERGEIGFMRSVELPDGRRTLVYAKFQITNPLHELQLTDVCLKVKADEIRRLHAVDQRFNADAEVVIDQKVFYVELDRGTEGYAQVRKQMKNYQDANADVLWIVPTITRMNGMMKGTTSGNLWFTTYAQSLTPHAEVWVNVHGEVAALPMPQGIDA